MITPLSSHPSFSLFASVPSPTATCVIIHKNPHARGKHRSLDENYIHEDRKLNRIQEAYTEGLPLQRYATAFNEILLRKENGLKKKPNDLRVSCRVHQS